MGIEAIPIAEAGKIAPKILKDVTQEDSRVHLRRLRPPALSISASPKGCGEHSSSSFFILPADSFSYCLQKLDQGETRHVISSG